MRQLREGSAAGWTTSAALEEITDDFYTQLDGSSPWQGVPQAGPALVGNGLSAVIRQSKVGSLLEMLGAAAGGAMLGPVGAVSGFLAADWIEHVVVKKLAK